VWFLREHILATPLGTRSSPAMMNQRIYTNVSFDSIVELTLDDLAEEERAMIEQKKAELQDLMVSHYIREQGNFVKHKDLPPIATTLPQVDTTQVMNSSNTVTREKALDMFAQFTRSVEQMLAMINWIGQSENMLFHLHLLLFCLQTLV
jgi:hypothetical protein